MSNIGKKILDAFIFIDPSDFNYNTPYHRVYSSFINYLNNSMPINQSGEDSLHVLLSFAENKYNELKQQYEDSIINDETKPDWFIK